VTTGPSQAVAINVTSGAQGGPFTSVVIVTPPNPSTGIAVVQNLQIIFTPAVTFSGTTTFTFALRNASATSAPALVTVSVSGRPDPSKDPNVGALVTAMTDAVERFISTEISNVTDRLGTLNSGGGGGVSFQGLSLGRWSGPNLASPGGVNRDWLARASGADERFAPAGATTALATTPAPPKLLGIWADGSFDLGHHDLSPARSPIDGGFSHLTAGIDYRFSDRVALGIAAGFAHDENVLQNGHDQGTRANGEEFTAYGAFRLGRDGFVDALAGTGTFVIDTRRFDPINSVQMTGARTGNDAFASVTAGRRFQSGMWQFSPYGGLTGDTADLRSFSEIGPGVGALTFGDQAVREMSVVLGVRADSRLGPAIGAVAPRFGIEYDRRLSATSVAPLWYADRPDTIFDVNAYQVGSRPLQLDAGATVRLSQAFLFNVDYRTIVDQAAVAHLLRLSVSTKL
jgi:uncharacterized protein YhjY with autotransporter beta-barrel domain